MSAPYIFIQAGTACPPINGGCHRGMPGCVAGVLQVCYSVLQYVAVCCAHQWRLPWRHAWVCCGCVASVLQRVSVCCSVLCPSMEAAAEESLGLLLVCCRCMAVCCRMLQCVAPINVGCHRSMPGCAVVRCRALKFAAECCSVL